MSSYRLQTSIVLMSAAIASADTLRVPSQFPTIQSAIDAAQPGDTVLVADGTYRGAGNKGLFYSNKTITVRSENGPSACILDGEDSGVAFWFVAEETPEAVAEGFTITNFRNSSGGAFFLHHDASPTIRDCTITGNQASSGGAIYCDVTASPVIVNCRITGNTATRGGGLYFATAPGASARIVNTVISDNSAQDGGGVWCAGAAPVILSSVIADNIASGSGGGLYTLNAGTTIVNTTLVGNTAGTFGGAIAAAGSVALVAVENSILWSNSAAAGSQIALVSIPNGGVGRLQIGFSDVLGGQAGVFVEPGGALNWLPGNISADPLFANPGAGDFHLGPLSPCIDAGDPARVVQPGERDLDGEVRVWAGRVDMGADEAGSHQLGDLNCDGAVDAGDAPALALALVDPAAYGAQFPACNVNLADMNEDGRRAGDDVSSFLAALLTP